MTLPSLMMIWFAMYLFDHAHRRPTRWILIATVISLLSGHSLPAQSDEPKGERLAYVGTFSSPLRDTLPTQIDLPPGNGRGIHLFKVDRDTGNLTAAGIHEMGTSPSCLTVNATRTRLYSANETDRVGADRQGTVSSFSIDPIAMRPIPVEIMRGI